MKVRLKLNRQTHFFLTGFQQQLAGLTAAFTEKQGTFSFHVTDFDAVKRSFLSDTSATC